MFLFAVSNVRGESWVTAGTALHGADRKSLAGSLPTVVVRLPTGLTVASAQQTSIYAAQICRRNIGTAICTSVPVAAYIPCYFLLHGDCF